MCREQELRYMPGESDEKALPSSFKICNNSMKTPGENKKKLKSSL